MLKIPGVLYAIPLVLMACADTQAQTAFDRHGCAGILHQDADGLRFGGGRGEDESICIIDASQADKVLQACAVGKYCRVVGSTGDCEDSGECVEIKSVTTASHRKVSRRR